MPGAVALMASGFQVRLTASGQTWTAPFTGTVAMSVAGNGGNGNDDGGGFGGGGGGAAGAVTIEVAVTAGEVFELTRTGATWRWETANSPVGVIEVTDGTTNVVPAFGGAKGTVPTRSGRFSTATVYTSTDGADEAAGVGGEAGTVTGTALYRLSAGGNRHHGDGGRGANLGGSPQAGVPGVVIVRWGTL